MGFDHLEQRQKLVLLVVIAAILAFGASLALTYVAGFDAVAERLSHPDWPWVAAAFGAEVVAYVGYILAYREVACAEGGAELRLPRAAALVSTGFGVFVAAGGFSLDAQALEHAGLDERVARARVVGLGALEYLVLASAAAVAAAYALVDHESIGLGLTLPWLVGVSVGLSVLAVLLWCCPSMEGRDGIRKRLGHCLHAVQLLRRLIGKPRPLGAALLGMALYWSADIFCL